MNRSLKLILALMFLLGMSQMAMAEHGGKEHGGNEHGGKEHGGKEHGGKKQDAKEPSSKEHGGKEHGGQAVKKVETPSNSDIRNAMEAYVMEQSEASGTFDVIDPDTGETLNLKLERVHERVGKTGDYYYSCADFKDVNTDESYDLDLDVADQGGDLSVVDVRVHKVNGEPRYTYDEKDNRIPLMDTKSHLGMNGSDKEDEMDSHEDSDKGSHKGSY